MNILIPDSWLREFLITKATSKQLKEYLSLCGPSIERVNQLGKETVYDIEITTNRVDSMSVYGVAREAAAILPRFGIQATLKPLAYDALDFPKQKLDISIDDPEHLCRRILAVKIANISLADSPSQIKNRLEHVGQRPLNNIVDITNYVMWETGNPVHAFDYDRLLQKKILVRKAKKGETVISLDKKKHSMVGGEVIFDDGTGEIIDIPGIMGTANTVITPQTKNVLLFIENAPAEHIRFTSMTHAIRTQAAVINEKDPDPELGLVAIKRAVQMATTIAGGTIGSNLFDQYPAKTSQTQVSVTRAKLDSYIGLSLSNEQIEQTLNPLGFSTQVSKDSIRVTAPSFRRDIEIDVDIIEEIARIYGYHAIRPELPSRTPPPVLPDPMLLLEESIKQKLCDWGFTEVYGYSMISADQMDALQLTKETAYTITNPLSDEWVYMRPALWATMLPIMKQNMGIAKELRLFELSMRYEWVPNDLPREIPTLVVAFTGQEFLQAKGLGERILSDLGIDVQEVKNTNNSPLAIDWYSPIHFRFGEFGTVGVVSDDILKRFEISTHITILELDLEKIQRSAHVRHVYTPVSKYPSAFEDIAFIVPVAFQVGPLLEGLRSVDPLIASVSLLDVHEDIRTIRVEYKNEQKNLESVDISPVREALLSYAESTFNIRLRTQSS